MSLRTLFQSAGGFFRLLPRARRRPRRPHAVAVFRRLNVRSPRLEQLEERTLLSATYYVDDTAAGLNNGSSWLNAFTSLQSALTPAIAGDQIHVAQGTYKPTTGTDRTISFALKNGVAIYGGYAGVGASNPDARDVALYSSILSGDIGTVGSAADNSYHVVVGSGTNVTAVLEGFTITAGNANGNSPNYNGGGMYNSSSSSPTLTNCTFAANSASNYGGGMYNWSHSSPSLTNCMFTVNSASAYGGGMYNGSSSPTLTNCTFTANSVSSDGGGMYNYSSSPTLANCTFTANLAGSGGGMYNYSSSSPTLINCTLTANSASSGGGVYNSSSSPRLTNCILWANSAGNGSQVYNSAATPVVTYCDVQDGSSGTGNINSDPQFVRNPGPGSDGQRGTADDDYGDLRLRLTSLCVDAGNSSAIPSGITTDVAGNSRRIDIPAKADSGTGTAPIVDMGAYEVVAAVQALAGGPYRVSERDSVALSGAGYSPNGLPISYTWDFDGDGQYDDATGPSPVFSAVGMQGPLTLTIALRVTDTSGAGASDSTVLQVARPLYVDDSATGLNDGTSWGNAFDSLQTALAVAAAGQMIVVGQGTYKPTPDTDRTATFQLKNGVAIYGGYAGNGTADPYARNVAFTSILSGDLGIPGSTADNSYHVVVGSGTNATAVLDGFTITAGYANGSSSGSYDQGGGMYNSAGSPTLANCTFTANSATRSYAGGGGMCNMLSSSPTLTNCTFLRNSAKSDERLGGGGGMYNADSSPTLTNCAFTANSCEHGGGGMFNSASSPTLVNCTFTANSANGNGFGGGMYNYSMFYSTSPTLTNCTFTANSASYLGGGMYSGDGRPQLTNCILWANTDRSGSQIIGSTAVVTYCDVQGGYSGAGNIDSDPQFTRDPSAGLDGQWGSADDDYGDLRLSLPSPCIDAGNNGAVRAGVATDMAGNSRFTEIPAKADTGLGTAPIVDLGAYETPAAVQVFVGGPYSVLEGGTVVLSGVGYSPNGPSVSYAWDFDGDGQFDDATGPSPVFSAVGMQAQTLTVALQVTDTLGSSATQSTVLRVLHLVYVDDTATGLNDGTSWANAFTSLQSALVAPVEGQVIRVAQGTYKPTTGTDRTASFTLRYGVIIYGGYAGLGASNPDARNVALYPSILSGDIGAVGSNVDNSYHVLTSSSVDATAILDGFTITAGNADGASSSGYGGGMYNPSFSSPTLANCTFVANSAFYGGGMYNQLSSSPTLTNCVFAANIAITGSGGPGGGIYNSGSSPTLINCTLAANIATVGGGMYDTSSSSPTLTNCILWANTAADGSQIYNDSGNPVVTHCDVQGGYSGSGNIDVDPQFVHLPNPGSDGIWSTADDWTDLRLRLTSPCIDAGNNAAVPPGVTTDLAGNPRFADIPASADTGDGTVPLVDLGAYEAPAVVQAWVGGPYGVLEGDTIVLSGAGYSPNGLTVSYNWDFDGDGQFDDATGPSHVFSGVGMQAQTLTIALQVTDTSGDSATQSTVLRVLRPIYVDDTATGLNDGSNWANAYTSLQSALVTTVEGQVIRVGQGTYKPTTGADRTISFTLKQGVAIYGGYAGIGASNPDLRDTTLYPTILSGDIGSLGDATDNSYHVVVSSFVNGATVLDGFTITAGNANGATSSGYHMGAGICNEGSSPTLMNCTFTANTAVKGAGIYNQSSSSPTLVNCTFTGNSTTDGGGAMHNWSYSSPTLTNCVFTANSGSRGGAMNNWSYSSPTFTNCTFTANSASIGGAIDNWMSCPTLTNCTFAANDAPSGASMANRGSSSATLTNCVLWTNTPSGGSPIYNDSSNPVVTYCDVQGGYTGTGNVNVDPQFIRAPSTGLDGAWGTVDDDYGDLRLRPASACVDAGNNAAVPAKVMTDLAGKPRFVDAPDVTDTGSGTSPIVDLGAYEVWYLFRRFYVDDNAVGLNDGTSWANAFTSLQSAMAAVVADEEIRVAQGTYRPTAGTDRAISFALKNDVALYGGYAGVGTLNPDARDVALYPSILSGDIGATGDTADNSYHVITSSAVDATAILDGFTITAGNANGASASGAGGGAYNSSCSPTITNCTFAANSAISGGGMYNSGASPRLTNCIFTADTSANGGGLYNTLASLPMLTDCTFTANAATSGYGGGMYNDGSAPTLKNCAFATNSATAGGAGMANLASSSPLLTNCRFTANLVTIGYGGGLYNAATSSPTLTGCTLTANFAISGGGIYNLTSSPTLTNCTFTVNSATSGSGGGVYNVANSSPTLNNSVLWANTASSGNQIYNSSKGSAKVTYCDVQGGYTGTGNVNADPQFIRAPTTGPDGAWGTADDDCGDLRLMPTSPCIDAGNNAAVPAGVTTDMAGNPRFVDLPGVVNTGSGTSPIVDLGAYESPNPAFAVSGSGDFTLGLTADHASLQIVTPGGSYNYAPAALTSLTFTGGAGDDRLTLDFTHGNPLPSGGIVFDAGLQNAGDSLVVQGTTTSQQLTLDGSKVKLDGQTILTLTGVEAFAFDLGGSDVTLPGASGLVKAGPGALTLAGVNAYLGGTTVLGGKLIVAGADALPSGTSLSIEGGSVVLDSGSTTAVKVSGLRFPSLHRPASTAPSTPSVKATPNMAAIPSGAVVPIVATAQAPLPAASNLLPNTESLSPLEANSATLIVVPAAPAAPAAANPRPVPVLVPFNTEPVQGIPLKETAKTTPVVANLAQLPTQPAAKQPILAARPARWKAPVKKAGGHTAIVASHTKATSSVPPAQPAARLAWFVNVWWRAARKRS